MLETEKLKNSIIEKFGTPCSVIDLDVVENNIKRAQSLCEKMGLANRPHVKTHKSPILAKMQIDAKNHKFHEAFLRVTSLLNAYLLQLRAATCSAVESHLYQPHRIRQNPYS